jgi:hypothetical protein
MQTAQAGGERHMDSAKIVAVFGGPLCVYMLV